MKFEWLFILKRIKNNKLVTILSVASLSLVISLIIMFLNTSSFFVKGSTNLQRVTYGNSDINISISSESESRFFSIDANDFVEDELIKEKCEYIYGFFSTFVKAQRNENTALARIFVSDLEELETYNKVSFESGTVNYLGSDQIVVSKSFATTNNLKINDRIKLSFSDKTFEYEVIGIGLNKGPFLQGSTVNNDILMSPNGFNRINRFYIKGLVTNCVIKVIDKKDIVTVYEHLVMIVDSSLIVKYTVDKALIQSDLHLISLPTNFIVTISLVFCTIALIVLFRLFAGKSKSDLQVLEKIGVTKKRQIALEGIFCFILTCLAMVFTLGIVQLFLKSIVALFPTFARIKLEPITFLIAYFAGLGISFLSTVFSMYARKAPIKKKIRTNFFFALSSVILSIIFIILDAHNIYLNIVAYIFFVLSIIIFSFVALNYCLGKLKNKYRNFALLHCNHSFKNPNSKKTFLFFLSSLILILTMTTIVSGIQDVAKKSSQIHPFDAVVTSINNPNQDLIEQISEMENVESVEKAAIFLNEVVRFKDSSKKVAIFGLEGNGFNNFASQEEFDGLYTMPNGVVISTIFMLQNNLKLGDSLNIFIHQIEYELVVVNSIECDFLLGNFILINVDLVSKDREYLHLALNFTEKNNQTINNIYDQFLDKNFTIIDLNTTQKYLEKSLNAFIDLLLFLIITFSLIITATNGVNILLCHEMNADFYIRLWKIGLDKQQRIMQSFINMVVGVVLFSAISLIAVFGVIEIFNKVVIIFNLYRFLSLDFYLSCGVVCVFALTTLLISLGINHKAKLKLN